MEDEAKETADGMVLAELRVSPVRCALAVLICVALGAALILGGIDALGRRPLAGVALAAIGGLAVALGLSLASRRGGVVRLTEAGLADGDGRQIARWDEIAHVDRGMFAMRPSRGVLIRTTRPLGRAWSPGLWWRIGRRAGLGGITRGTDARAMADILTLRQAEAGRQEERPPL